MHNINPLIALGVTCSTATTDAVYVLFTSAVSAHRRISAATWSSLWYVLSAFAVISYTSNSICRYPPLNTFFEASDRVSPLPPCDANQVCCPG